jgi:peptidyl-prolyl cis-trans isomerase C
MKNILIVLLLCCIFQGSTFANTTYQNIEEKPSVVKLEAVKQVSAGHILVDTYAQAISLKKRIENGESFERLARQYSKCPSAQRGGTLGSFGRGQMVKPFENAAFNLNVGEVSEPVKTQFGWHLIKVYNRG